MKTQTRLLLIAAIVAISATACETPRKPAQSTSVDRVLMSPNISNKPYGRILVIGVVPSRETARRIEIAVMRELDKHRVESFSFVRDSDATEPTEEAVLSLVAEIDADGVIVVSGDIEGTQKITTEERTEFETDVQMGPASAAPAVTQPGSGQLSSFFRTNYRETVSRTATTVQMADVRLVSDFYDVETQNRVYSVQSSTRHGTASHEVILAEGRAIVRRLRQDGMIR